MLKFLEKDILSWKRKYRDIFYFKIGNNLYIFRTLTKGEYFNFISTQHSINVDMGEHILKECLLYPEFENMDDCLAGEIDYILKSIIGVSGFANEDKLLKDIESERNKINILDTQIVLLICKAFPQLTPDNIDQLNYYQLLRYLALAEAILDTKLVIEKPKPEDTIDFNQDNKDLMKGSTMSNLNPKQRGDVS